MLPHSVNTIVSFFLGLSNPQNTNVYDEIHEYEELRQNKEEKRNQNHKAVDKIYIKQRK